MLTGLLLIVFGAVVVAVVWSLLRRTLRRSDPPQPAELDSTTQEPPALPAPAPASGEVFLKLRELAFGVALQEPAVGKHEEIVAAVSGTLESVATEPRYAPRRPLLLPQLLRAVNDDETSRRELAGMIARDPALAGSLLMLANSPFYRIQAQPVESIDRAVALLGTDGIRSLIATAIMQPVFRVAGGEFARFPEVSWEHTLRSAAAVEAHAAIVENADPFAAQLLGLIMGLAEIVVFRVAMDQYSEHSQLRPDASLIASLIVAFAAPVARRIAASWDLSARILAALEDQAPATPPHEPTPLGRSLRFGRLLGALAVLHAEGRIDEETARAAVDASGVGSPHAERIWMRLTGLQPRVRGGHAGRA